MMGLIFSATVTRDGRGMDVRALSKSNPVPCVIPAHAYMDCALMTELLGRALVTAAGPRMPEALALCLSPYVIPIHA
jgi:hypothetical protein